MATPAIAGSVSLIRQYLMEGFYPTGQRVPADAFVPSGSLLKALAIAGATRYRDATDAPHLHEMVSSKTTLQCSELVEHDLLATRFLLRHLSVPIAPFSPSRLRQVLTKVNSTQTQPNPSVSILTDTPSPSPSPFDRMGET